MKDESAPLKIKFSRALEPIKVMLVHKKKHLDKEAWLSFIESTKNSIINHPDQYLDSDLRPSDSIKKLVELIFKEFLENERSA